VTTQQRSGPAQSSATAIDIALEPDQAMVERAGAVNARLRGVYPAGFALDAVHHPHVTMLQQFVSTADLEGVFAAADEVFAGVQLATWQLRAFRYYYIPSPPIGLAGIVIEPTDDLLALQRNLIDAIAPYAVETGTAAAFASADEGRDIQESLIEYVATFVGEAAGEKFNPHVTVGAATAEYLDQMLAEPFEAFSFSPIGASIYQLGTFGTAQRQLTRLPLTR
jgi:hypothetical protein